MADRFGSLIAGLVDRLLRWLVMPVTSLIPRLVESGVLLALFALLWAAFGLALVASPTSLDEASRWLAQQALPVQGVAWLLFLPVTAGLWVIGTDWPLVVRLAVIAGLGGWNLLVFLPRRPAPAEHAVIAGGI